MVWPAEEKEEEEPELILLTVPLSSGQYVQERRVLDDRFLSTDYTNIYRDGEIRVPEWLIR